MDQWADNDGVRIAWERRGASEGTPVVLVHGLGYGRWGWEPVVDTLAERLPVVLLDNRGIGASDVPPGPYNPLGARALYLYQGGRDTLYRIHGTNSAGTVGGYETSGCFRLTNADVLDLYAKVRNGTKVIVK